MRRMILMNLLLRRDLTAENPDNQMEKVRIHMPTVRLTPSPVPSIPLLNLNLRSSPFMEALTTDFGDDARSTTTVRSILTAHTDKTLSTTTPSRSKKSRDV